MTSLVTARRASGFLRALPGRSAFPEAGVMGGPFLPYVSKRISASRLLLSLAAISPLVVGREKTGPPSLISKAGVPSAKTAVAEPTS